MARKSSIDRLPAEVRELIAELRHQGRTIDEIMAHLRELDVEVSRSALGRHTQEIDVIAERLNANRAVAEAAMARIEGKPMGNVARMNIELLHAALTDLTSGGITDARQAMFLATTVQKLASAAKVDLDRELKVRDEVAREMVAKLENAEREATDAGEPGLSAERVAQLRRDFLGVRSGAPA